MKKIELKEELPINESIKEAYKLTFPQGNVIRRFFRAPFWNDEPKFFRYIAEIVTKKSGNSDKYSHGISSEEEKAKIKALGEAIERYSLEVYKSSKLIIKSANKLPFNFIRPSKFIAFSETQLQQKEFKICKIENTSTFRWTDALDVFSGKTVYLPAQVIYVPYYFLKNEPLLRFPISTGAAAGTSMGGAIYRGVCEVVERDAFMIYWLNKIPPIQLDLETIKCEPIKEIFETFLNYYLEWYAFYLKTDIPVPVILSLLIDKSKEGPAVSIGLKAGFSVCEAIIDSALEAEAGRIFVRSILYSSKKIKIKNYKNITSFEERGMWWARKDRIKLLRFLFEGKKVRNVPKNYFERKNIKEKIEYLFRVFKRMKYPIFIKDITPKEIKIKSAFKVVKVIIPDLCPLHLDERYKYLGCTRIYEVPKKLGYESKDEKELNKIPHPFV
jgi:ribosomal protein S12 methylthiotransferase accessory factor